EHDVRLTRGLWLADSECTQALWSTVTDQAPSEFPNPLQPVESVTREDCQRFLDLLNARIPNLRARLPSEAEWEYAARAGTIAPFIHDDRVTKTQACIRGADQPCAVKSFAPNPWGLYDIVGNVREWCADTYEDYPENAAIDPLVVGDGRGVTRGGCWDDSPGDCRVARRHETKVRAKSAWNGLRIAFDAPPATNPTK
ncbi:MAG TPA: formylglycine-generating enzyme family protein, partial [Planctomycetota bacterium]|nr:formylglycine-generating enzyme family protein [Planctomycetota bacterium]